MRYSGTLYYVEQEVKVQMKTKVEVIRKMTSKNNDVAPYTYMVIDDGDKSDYSVMTDSHAYVEFSDLVTRMAMEFGSFFYVKDYGVTGWV